MNPSELKKPNVSEELAIELALRFFGVRVKSIKRMVSYDDQNFHIKVFEDFQNPGMTSICPEGYTLKVTNTKKSIQPGNFDTMHCALRHLHNKGLSVPVPVPLIQGGTWVLVKVPLRNESTEDANELCGIHMLTFVPGQNISTITYTRNILFQWGYLLAKFHIGAEDLESPDLKKKKIFWDMEHLMEIKDFMAGLDLHKQNLVHSVLDQFPELVEKNLLQLPKGIIHGDFNENNILVQKCENSTEGKNKYIVSGILDFEDIHYATYVWDIAVMLAYALLDCTTMDPLEGVGHALAGYLALRPLSELEISLLQICSACRLCQSLVLGAYSYSLDPTNSYLLHSAKTGWIRLEQLWNTNNKELIKKWKKIQDQYKTQENYVY